ncbi:MAG: ubiquinol-cytochrome c reductase iron-sulfur subunit [Bacteroidota bacterium]|nr:ubiquinol-cytochrome c reductase iron-sulfur subunit [Bacteroidota bacterium]MDP4229647.1 ubiquinol-cytochrome c reductase iron-sulfur subunit [Bacteroidota bacterium]MDP4237019.1 ubiquinol-cytochrome c reductase iron-sulfur subunit [Bacteroidota bacterium]
MTTQANTDASGASPKSADTQTLTGRRSFLGWLLGIGTVTVGGLLSVPLVRFALHPLTDVTTETAWSDLGSVDELSTITAPKKVVITVNQVDGWRKVIQEKSVYVVKEGDGKLKVLTSICPHLGCSVRYDDGDKKFACPCHKGVFETDGKLVSGPPPRNLDELDSRIADGKLQVRYQSFRQLVPTKEVIA